jgi:hydrogenase nickel incorporation protein HypB
MREHTSPTPAALLSALDAEPRRQDANGRAAATRSEFGRHGVVAVNLMGAPSSGRTRLLEETAHALVQARLGVLLAGPAVEADAWRLVQSGVPTLALPIRRGGHVDAAAVDGALQDFAWRYLDYLFVENVGGLVSPAFHDLGETRRVVALSATDAADQPLKYPDVFRDADLVVVTKADLLPSHLGFDAIASALACVMRRPAFVVTSARTGQGIGEWAAWLERSRPVRPGEPARRRAFGMAPAPAALTVA